jgi:hypothetical protein
MNWITQLMNDYYQFIKEKTIITSSNQSDWVEISTPFLGLFNDTVDIYAQKIGSTILLSDDGNTLRNLELSGMEINRSTKRQEILNSILLNYGVKINNNSEFITEATEKDFPQKKLNLISAIVEASEMCNLARHTTTAAFKEEVKTYLDKHEFIYTPHFIYKGNTGLEFSFDFQIAYRKSEIVIKSFNSITKTNLSSFLFTWKDIKEIREKMIEKEVIGLAIINNVDTNISQEYIDALNTYGAQHILWTERETSDSIQKLRAA